MEDHHLVVNWSIRHTILRTIGWWVVFAWLWMWTLSVIAVGQRRRWSVASSDAEAGSREMVCPICREMLKPAEAQTHLILEFSQLKQLVNT